ncbi:MAG: DUF3267 domain-containing protein [Clostridiales bacterium]|nr:DUF3267 domain-containing protein [Clostridiales bacterium]
MEKRNFENELPKGYKQALYINAKKAKFGIIFNLIALVVLAIVMTVSIIPLYYSGRFTLDIIKVGRLNYLVAMLVFVVALIGYIVLHELVHGIAYKILTGEKLTFGISWSCAFCGVPHIYTYRKTAIISVSAPLVLFTLILSPITALLYFVSPLYYLISAFILGIHLGGCSGDIYVLLLLGVKFRKKNVLMRDTGPEQFFYVKEEENG